MVMHFDRSILLAIGIVFVPADAFCDQVAAERRARLKQMPAAEKEALSRKHKRFSGLPVDEQGRLRRLHGSLENNPRAEHLRNLMLRYHQWLQTLPSGQRAELLGLSPQARLEEIKRILKQQEGQRFNTLVSKQLLPADQEAILAWLNDLILRHEEEIAATLPRNLQGRVAGMSPAERRRTLLFRARQRSGPGRSPIDLIQLDDADVRRLSDQLSEQVRHTLEEVQDDQQRQDLLRSWVAAANLSRRLPQVSQRELRTFHGNLPPETREHLENLPRDRRRSELRQLYMKQRFQEKRRPFRRRPRGGPARRNGK